MTFLEILEKTLLEDARFVAEDGSVLKAKVYDAAMTMDDALLELLLSEKTLKRHFFKEVKDLLVFDKVRFTWVLNSREFLPDSFTMYKNKIGLADDKGDMVSQKNDVALVWPYKDCVLEGGQTKEEEKRDEVFYNEIIAPDQVTRLLYPKVLCNAKRYAYDGELDLTGQPFGDGKADVACEPTTEFRDGDNLIIKGNNLLALSSLLRQYEGKVKLIYIDPPYNTQNDNFSYNDSFNRSSWLSFMRSRLILAKSLLSPEGAIYVQLDYHQVHYAKVLFDEIYGEDNFQREIIWRIGWLSGYKTADQNWIRNHDTILFYSKDRTRLDFKKHYIPREEFKDIAQSSAERYPIEDVWNASEYDDLNSIAIVSFSGETVSKMLNPDDEVKGQKSEKLIERIIKAHTEEGDLVLDFFSGTGTTAAVSHKLNRQYIVCEQLEKHIDIALRRMGKVVQGEQSGISRRNNWHGGGSFVYCELAERSETLAGKLQLAENSEDVLAVLDQATDDGLLRPSILPDDLKKTRDDFLQFSLQEQKQLVMELLDKNKLYINLCDLDDEEMQVSEEDRAFTRSFYGMDKDTEALNE